MDSLMKSDIFFFIATIALVVISIGVTIAIVYIVLILRNVKEFTDRAKEEGKAIVNDVRLFRENVKSQGKTVKNLTEFFIGKIISKTVSKKRGTKKEE